MEYIKDAREKNMWLEYTDENGLVHRWYEPLDD